MSPTITRRLLAGVLAGALTVGLAACGDDDTTAGAGQQTTTTVADSAAGSESSGVRVVAPEAAQQLLADDPGITLIDVRTPEEYAQGHLEGAQLIDLQAPDFQDRIAELDRDGSYVIYCHSGNRSAQARQLMDQLGFADVADVDGGITAWTAAGLPVVTD